MGGGGQTGTVTPEIPAELKPLIEGSTAGTVATQNALPLYSFGTQAPRSIADLSDMQMFGMERIPSLYENQPGLVGAMGAYSLMPEISSLPINTSAAENQQYGLLGGLTGGPIGSSPATSAGMEAWRQSVLPAVEQDMVQAGLGRSGDLLKAVGSSASQAAFPLIQQEISNRMQAVPMYGQLEEAYKQRQLIPRQMTLAALQAQGMGMADVGKANFDQEQAAIQTALQAGQISRDIAQQRSDAAYDDFIRLQKLAEQATFGPTQLLSSTIGSHTSTERDPGIAGWFGK
jgi:hypothetical protein